MMQSDGLYIYTNGSQSVSFTKTGTAGSTVTTISSSGTLRFSVETSIDFNNANIVNFNGTATAVFG